MQYTNGLAKEDFLEHIFSEFPTAYNNQHSRQLLENIVDYCTEDNFTHTKNQLYYTLKQIIPELEDKDLLPYMDKNVLTGEVLNQDKKSEELDNGYIFVFENEFCFSKLKDICEYSQELASIPDGTEFAIITNAEVTKEAFLVKYDNNIEIVFNFYNKDSSEMETYENEIFDMSEINSKEELINKMKEKLEHFEEKYNKLEQDEEDMEV